MAIISAIIIVVAVTLFHSPDRLLSDERNHLNSQISRSLDALRNDIGIDLQYLAYSALFIVDQTRLHKPFSSKENASIFSEDFISMLNTSEFYDQLRLINSHGMEVVRANFNRGDPSLADQEELQNKSNRYYFQKSIILKEHEVYLSPLDLNVENGEIERPLKPTLRIGMPTFDHLGNKQGIVMVNAMAEPMIKHFLERSKPIHAEHISWLNDDGYWLAGATEEKLWGFMYNERKQSTMALEEPEVWQSVMNSSQGIINSSHGTYLFTTVHPYKAFSGTADLQLNRDKPYEWKLLAYYSNHYFEDYIAEKSFNSRLIMLLSGLLLASLFLLFASWYQQQRNRAESEKQEHIKESEQIRMKSTGIIATGIAHEFNNILSAITANLYLLKTGSEQTESGVRALKSMDRLVDRAARLVKYLLTFSRYGFVSKDHIALSDVTREIVQQSIKELPSHFFCNIQINPNIHITGDHEKITSMVKEVISNAIDALQKKMEPRLSVNLAITEEMLDSDKEKAALRRCAILTVEDNGEGISSADMKHIYDPFFSTKEVGKGSGLGLSAVLGTVKFHHGEINIESSEGIGTCVRIYLPLNQPESHMDQELK